MSIDILYCNLDIHADMSYMGTMLRKNSNIDQYNSAKIIVQKRNSTVSFGTRAMLKSLTRATIYTTIEDTTK